MARATLWLLLGVAEAQRAAKPHLSLSLRPQAINVGQSVSGTAKLTGIDESADYVCPDVEWSWGDGSSSALEGNCPSPEGPHPAARQFSSDHVYNGVGEFHVEVSVRPTKGSLLRATGVVNVTREGPSLTISSPRPHG